MCWLLPFPGRQFGLVLMGYVCIREVQLVGQFLCRGVGLSSRLFSAGGFAGKDRPLRSPLRLSTPAEKISDDAPGFLEGESRNRAA